MHVQIDEARASRPGPTRRRPARRRARRGRRRPPRCARRATSTSAISSRPAAGSMTRPPRTTTTPLVGVAHGCPDDTPWMRALISRCRRSMSSSPGATSRPSSTTIRPFTTVCRADDGPAPQPRLDRVASARPRTRSPSSGQHTRSPTAPGARAGRARPSRPRHAGRTARRDLRARRARPVDAGPPAQPAEQQRVARLHPQRRGVGRRRAVAPEPDRHARGAELRAPARCRRRRSACSSSGSARRRCPTRPSRAISSSFG